VKKLLAALRGRRNDHVALQVSTPKSGGLQVSGRAADVLELARWWEASRPDATPDAPTPRTGFQKAD
jgi:hypothetical protein